MTCNRGNISSSGKQPSGPVPFISAPVNRPARPSGGAKRFTEAVEWGRGVMSVVGGREEEIPTPSLSQGGYPGGLGQGAGTGSQKR